jgi:hypothetical protein
MKHFSPCSFNRTCWYVICVAFITHYTTLHCTTLHYTALHHTTLHCTTLHYTALYYTTLHHTTLHCTILHHRWRWSWDTDVILGLAYYVRYILYTGRFENQPYYLLQNLWRYCTAWLKIQGPHVYCYVCGDVWGPGEDIGNIKLLR